MLKSFIEFIRRQFTTPTADTLALRELEDARRQLLVSQSAAEYAANMVKYHAGRVSRLTSALRVAS